MMHSTNIDLLIKQKKDLAEELYRKNQESDRHRESINSFLRNTMSQEVGTIFFRSGNFIFGNKAARDLIQMEPKKHRGHPFIKALYKVVHNVQRYTAPYMLHAKDSAGKELVFAGMTNLDRAGIIINVYYPDVTDIIKKQINGLKHSSDWDYILYLETTQSGKLVNTMIPGYTPLLLNFKIALLKAVLSKKVTILNMPEDDLDDAVQLFHSISMRDTLHMIMLDKPVKNEEIAMQLFGIDSLYNKNHQIPLLKKFDRTGTIFIKNIHFLDLETQNHLAEFLRYGFFHILKSDIKMAADVRIICSSDQNLYRLVQEDKFSRDLLAQLQLRTITLPSIGTLPEDDLLEIIVGFCEHVLFDTPAYNIFFALSQCFILAIIKKRPLSLVELKKEIQNIIKTKTKQTNIQHDVSFDPAYGITDPELAEIALLDKKALDDKRAMTVLWYKFNKNQAQIAAFLGVNRSTVNRRCKQFNLVK